MIGTLRETELHAALKRYYARPHDRLEVQVDRYVIDLVRDDELVEIQTHNFAALRRKLPDLLKDHPVRLVYPIAQARWIIRVTADRRTVIGRRKSPRPGALEDLFVELVSLPEWMAHPHFALDVVLIQEEEIRCLRSGGQSDRTGKWRVCDRRLLNVIDTVTFATPRDFQRFIPPDLSSPFTSRQLAEAKSQPEYLAHKITYCLRKMNVLTVVGKRHRAWLYALTD